MKKSGLADSPFFLSTPAKNEDPTPPSPTLPVEKEQVVKNKKTKKPSNHDTVVPRHHDTTVSRIHDAMIELVRKAVKEFGKEAATHRFTQLEKTEIGNLIFTYKNQGIKTSENEITRIAVNFIFEDHKENGENSVLHKIIEALNG